MCIHCQMQPFCTTHAHDSEVCRPAITERRLCGPPHTTQQRDHQSPPPAAPPPSSSWVFDVLLGPEQAHLVWYQQTGCSGEIPVERIVRRTCVQQDTVHPCLSLSLGEGGEAVGSFNVGCFCTLWHQTRPGYGLIFRSDPCPRSTDAIWHLTNVCHNPGFSQPARHGRHPSLVRLDPTCDDDFSARHARRPDNWAGKVHVIRYTASRAQRPPDFLPYCTQSDYAVSHPRRFSTETRVDIMFDDLRATHSIASLKAFPPVLGRQPPSVEMRLYLTFNPIDRFPNPTLH